MNIIALFVCVMLCVATMEVNAQTLTAVAAPVTTDTTLLPVTNAADGDAGSCAGTLAATAEKAALFTITIAPTTAVFNVSIVSKVLGGVTMADMDSVEVKTSAVCPIGTKFTDNSNAGKAVFNCPATASGTAGTALTVEQKTAGKIIVICDIKLNKNAKFLRFDWTMMTVLLLAAVKLTVSK